MQKSESIFWSVVGISAVYIAFTFIAPARANTQPLAAPSAQAAAQPSQGMGCMAKGGGCGCGAMMKKN